LRGGRSFRLKLCRKDAAKYLKELGCTVYNPNVDNLEKYGGDKKTGDSAWLKTFAENVQIARDKKGFVLQLQQGGRREKSDMQEAEEMVTGWRGVPRIAMWVYEEGFSEERREPNGVGINGGGGFYASSRCSYQIPSDGGLAQTTSTSRPG
jgi:hypothetical protein